MLLHETIHDHSWFEQSHFQYTKTKATACAISKQWVSSGTRCVPRDAFDCFELHKLRPLSWCTINVPAYSEGYLQTKDTPTNGLLPAIAPNSLNPRILSRPGVFRCPAVQRLRALLGIFYIDYETSLVAWRIHSFHSRARRAAHPDASAP
jgi:hypothetical protein